MVPAFLLSLMLGTVFFSLIQNSINHGFRTGLLIATGVVLSDVIFISIALFGSTLLPNIEHYQRHIEITGGALLVALAISLLVKKASRIQYPPSGFGGCFYYISNGFLLNILNPVNLFSWVAIMTFNTSMGYKLSQHIIYFVACLMAIFSTEMLISLGAVRIKRFFNEKVMNIINKITGAVFLLFGLRLIFDPLF